MCNCVRAYCWVLAMRVDYDTPSPSVTRLNNSSTELWVPYRRAVDTIIASVRTSLLPKTGQNVLLNFSLQIKR